MIVFGRTTTRFEFSDVLFGKRLATEEANVESLLDELQDGYIHVIVGNANTVFG